MGIVDRLKNAWNAFGQDEEKTIKSLERDYPTHSILVPQQRPYHYVRGTFVDTIKTRIANDVSMVDFKHVRFDTDPKTEETIHDGLHECLSLEANLDQSATDFIKDVVYSMLDEGVVAMVPTDIDTDPNETNSFEVLTLRAGKITYWYPESVRVLAYDQATGLEKEVLAKKRILPIIHNPLYEIMNAPNSAVKRLSRKEQLLDSMDETIASNKLDLIIQLPYTTNTDLKKDRAQSRLKDIEEQLSNNKYGIAYIDNTEHVTQLNRSVENNLLKEIEMLKEEILSSLGLTKGIFDGTASEQELRAYYDRTIHPIAKRIADECNRKFLTQTARTQGHKIVYYTDPFRLVPISQIASISDTLRRNTILSTNEIRGIIGFQPSDDPRADELFNPNIADSNQIQNGSETVPQEAVQGTNNESIAEQPLSQSDFDSVNDIIG